MHRLDGGLRRRPTWRCSRVMGPNLRDRSAAHSSGLASFLHPRLWLVMVFPVMACSHRDPLVASDPAVCVAAFDSILKRASETPLERDPQNFVLKMRMTLELDHLRKTIGLEKGQERAESFSRRLSSNFDKSADLAEECIYAEGKDGEFERRRDELREIVSDSQRTH